EDVRAEPEIAPRGGDGDEAVREPRERLEEVVRVARRAPEAAPERLPAVRGIRLEAPELLVGDELAGRRCEPERRPGPFDRLEAGLAVEGGEHERHREERG